MGQEFRKLLFIDVIFGSGTDHADKCTPPATRFAVRRSSSAVVLPLYVTVGRSTIASWAFRRLVRPSSFPPCAVLVIGRHHVRIWPIGSSSVVVLLEERYEREVAFHLVAIM